MYQFNLQTSKFERLVVLDESGHKFGVYHYGNKIGVYATTDLKIGFSTYNTSDCLRQYGLRLNTPFTHLFQQLNVNLGKHTCFYKTHARHLCYCDGSW
jgi:hypothetical protein